MSKDFGSETLEGVANSAQQVQVTIDDSQTPCLYSSNARVWGSPEEINVDFAGPIKPTGPKSALLKIDQRVILNPWAAKRLSMLLANWVQRYEEAYGPLELDERRRRVGPQAPAPAMTPPMGKPN